MVGNIFGGILGKVVENAEGILDKVITTDKERDAAKLAIKKLMLEAEKEAFATGLAKNKQMNTGAGLLGMMGAGAVTGNPVNSRIVFCYPRNDKQIKLGHLLLSNRICRICGEEKI